MNVDPYALREFMEDDGAVFCGDNFGAKIAVIELLIQSGLTPGDYYRRASETGLRWTTVYLANYGEIHMYSGEDRRSHIVNYEDLEDRFPAVPASFSLPDISALLA